MLNDSKQFPIEKFYDGLSHNWDHTRPTYTFKIFKKISSYLVKNNSSRVLDFGCGTGLFCKYVKENYPQIMIEGIDVSGRMIEKATANCPSCTFYAGDILQINLPSYDAIISKDVFNHIPEIDNVLFRLNELTNPEGIIVIANRERNQTTKKEILVTLKSLQYQVSEENFLFTPTQKEINSFLDTLSAFDDRHKAIMRKRLEESGDYYILYARKNHQESAC